MSCLFSDHKSLHKIPCHKCLYLHEEVMYEIYFNFGGFNALFVKRCTEKKEECNDCGLIFIAIVTISTVLDARITF